MLSCRRAFMTPRKNIHLSEPQEFVVHRSLKSPTEVKASRTTTIKMLRTTMSSKKIEPHRNDVLLGRGGKNNQHSGNEKLREISKLECEEYRGASKKGKSNISRGLVDQMKALSPAGRFLKRADSGKWEDVGDDVAREKASQVLRDAVAIEMGPLASSSSNKRKDKEVTSRSTGSSRFEEEAEAECRRQSSAPPSQRECRPDREQSSASIWSRAETPRVVASLSSGAPPYLPVTPISSSYEPSRKRPRYHHEAPYFYGQHSSSMMSRVTTNTPPLHVSSPMIGMTRSTPPSQVMSPMVAPVLSRNTPPSSHAAMSPMIGVTRMTPPQQVYQPPAPRSAGQLSHPGSFFHQQFIHTGYSNQRYHPAPNSAPRSTTSSARAGGSHFVPQSSEQPLAEPGILEPTVHNSDFELFNGELLSDQESDREGTRSPSPFRFHYHRDYPDSI